MSESGFLEGGLAMLRHGPPKSQEEIDRERARSISNGACGLRKRRDRALPGAPRRQLQSRSPPSARAAAQPRVHVDLRRVCRARACCCSCSHSPVRAVCPPVGQALRVTVKLHCRQALEAGSLHRSLISHSGPSHLTLPGRTGRLWRKPLPIAPFTRRLVWWAALQLRTPS